MHAPCATRHAYARWRLCACVQLAQLLAVCRTVHAASDKLPQVPAAGLCRLPSASDWLTRNGISTMDELRSLDKAKMATLGLNMGQRNCMASWISSHSSDDAGSADGRGTAAGSGADGADHVGAHYCSGPNGRRCQDVEVLPWSEGLFSSMEQKAQRGLGRNRPFLIRRDSSPAREWAALKPGGKRRWSIEYMMKHIKKWNGMTVDKRPDVTFWSVKNDMGWEMTQNEAYWTRIDGGTATRADKAARHKMFRWSAPNAQSSAGSRTVRAIVGAESQREYRIANAQLLPSLTGEAALGLAALTMRDMKPLTPIMPTPEELVHEYSHDQPDVDRPELNLWASSTNATSTMHYDVDHNVVVQVHGRKHWLLLPPSMLNSPALALHPEGHPSVRHVHLRKGSTPSIDVDAIVAWNRSEPVYEVTMEPGDVLAVPAYWLHHVRAVDGSSFSVNTWRTCTTHRKTFSQFSVLYVPNMRERLQRSKTGLQKLIISVVLGVFFGNPHAPHAECREISTSADVWPTQARACASKFVQARVMSRWAPMFENFDHPDNFVECNSIAWRSMASAAAVEQRKKLHAAYFVAWPGMHRMVDKIVQIFRDVIMVDVVATYVADWLDNICYTQREEPAWQGSIVKTKAHSGMRGCAAYFRSCFK